jgi:hypothetical protein
MTVRGWWRRRKFALSSRPADLPHQPDQMEDMRLQASANGAAEEDVRSGAYDEFLFSEDNLDQMPYERMVDDQLALTRVRLFDRARRAVLKEHQKLIAIKSDVEQLRNRKDIVDRNIVAKEEKLADELAVLNGQRPGRAELMWPGNPPQQTSLINAWMRLMLPYLVFVIVGAVDLGIIQASFREIFERNFEAWLFTMPAVGVQIVFPHFIGDRINLWVHGFKKRWLLAGELFVLLTVWLTFVFTLTTMRMTFLKDTLSNFGDEVYYAVYAGFICTILGLGLWLLLVAARHNPHESTYARLNFSLGRMRRRSDKLEQKALAAEAGVPGIQEALNVAEKGYRDAIDSAPIELADAVKSVYRRALINLTREVDFTAAYLGVAHPNAKKSRKEKFAARVRDKETRRSRQRDLDLDDERRTHRDNFEDTTDDETPN